MNHIYLFENFNEASVSRANPGDIAQSQRGKYVILDYPKIGRTWNEYEVIHMADVEKALKDPESVPVATWKIRQGSYMDVVGTIPKAQLEKIKEAYAKKKHSIETHNAEFKANKYQQNSPLINWKSNSPRYNDGEYVVTMADGNIAKAGDVVAVKFSNGVFNGTIKQIAGREDSQVVIVFRGKTKGRGIDPKNILKKISA